LRVELRSSLGNKVPASGTNYASNITLITASSVAAQNEYITYSIAGNGSIIRMLMTKGC
jgi:hypothetical protein